MILDGKLFDTDRLTETTTSVKGEPIDAWYFPPALRVAAAFAELAHAI